MNAPAGKFAENEFEIRDGELYRGSEQFAGCDYMVVRILTKTEKVWRTIPSIDKAIDAAVAKGTSGKRDQAVALLYAAQAVVLDCEDLSFSDQERVVNAIWDHYNSHVPTNAKAPRGSSIDGGTGGEPLVDGGGSGRIVVGGGGANDGTELLGADGTYSR